jgi:hypothetical protein
MVRPGQIPGRYNIVVASEYDTFDRREPIEDFVEQLEDDEVPDEVTVSGLEQALEDGDLIDRLSRTMDRRADDLEYQSTTIQFVVDGSFHRRGKTFDLRHGDKLYPLQEVFGPQLERKEDGNWLVAPF